MIISHKYKFIFIKTLKTAGTSIEYDLNNLLGPQDICTPIYPNIEGHVPRNYDKGFYNHISANEIIKFIGWDTFKNYFSFCVEREPVDKSISHYSMMKNSKYHNVEKNLSFEDYIKKKDFPNDIAKYTDNNGKLLINRILKYENLKNELKEIFKIIGLDFSLKSNAKNQFRENVNPTNKQKKIIYQNFQQSLVYTGYKLN